MRGDGGKGKGKRGTENRGRRGGRGKGAAPVELGGEGPLSRVRAHVRDGVLGRARLVRPEAYVEAEDPPVDGTEALGGVGEEDVVA